MRRIFAIPLAAALLFAVSTDDAHRTLPIVAARFGLFLVTVLAVQALFAAAVCVYIRRR